MPSNMCGIALVVMIGCAAIFPQPAGAAVFMSQDRTASKAKAARSLAAAGVPDPMCKTGVIAIGVKGQPQACCAGYCGECSDYYTCKSVRGQDSTNACCASNVTAMECGKGAPANTCLKKCSESVPPCIMDGVVYDTKPKPKNAASNCTEAIGEWDKKVDAAIKAAKKPAAAAVFVSVPDPMCKTGVIAIGVKGQPQACCAGYCGECSDYYTCKSVRGQDSTNACCASNVTAMECGKGAPANTCLKKCSESVPPCIMDGVVYDTKPKPKNAASNCTEAIGEWDKKVDAAIKAAKKP